MDVLGTVLMLGGWLWSVIGGVQVSILCAILNFVFPPLSQIIYSVYEQPMRMPLIVMIAGIVVLYFAGADSLDISVGG
ncbi:hypothetical protein KFE80_04180 [bacterium SCSIO 12696]|nr:hypothetical protein KFE80_04180 [bacterium SCSIO 12696]